MMHQVWKNERPNHAEQIPEKHDLLYAGGQSGNINITSDIIRVMIPKSHKPPAED